MSERQLFLFDSETEVVTSGEGRWTVELSEQWNIGVNPNGGYVSSTVIAAMLESTPHSLPLSITTHFQRPALANQTGQIEVEVIRTGRTTSTLSGKLIQDGKERVRLLGTFGDFTPADSALGSASISDGLDIPVVELPPPDQCRSRSELAQGIDLPIMSRLDVRIPDRWAIAGEVGEAVIGGWIRHIDERPPDARSLVVFCDAFPPSPFGLYGRLGWVPTLELTVHVRRQPAPGWIRARFETRDLVGGLVVEDGVLWDSTGALVAQCRQLALLRVDQ